MRIVVAQVMDDVKEESRYELRELLGEDSACQESERLAPASIFAFRDGRIARVTDDHDVTSLRRKVE